MPSGQELKDGGVKHDESKRRMDLVPSSLISAVARVLGFGAKKYGDNNWRQGLAWSRVYAALQRHLVDFWAGQDEDPESGLSHLYHAACNIAFLIEYYETHKDLDDRYKANEKPCTTGYVRITTDDLEPPTTIKELSQKQIKQLKEYTYNKEKLIF